MSINYNGTKTSIANVAMLQFVEAYASENGYLEEWVMPDNFWANAADRLLHPEKPQVIEVSFVLPMFDTDKEEKGYWGVPRVKIDSYWGKPRINVVDKEGNFCCLAYDREANEFREGQFWNKDGLHLANAVKTRIDGLIKKLEKEYGAERTSG